MRKANHTRETARVQANGNDSRQVFRKSLRNANINYRNGWFFVTFQVAHNKSIFGAIVGERCELNELGRQVEARWRELPAKYPELELDEFTQRHARHNAEITWPMVNQNWSPIGQ